MKKILICLALLLAGCGGRPVPSMYSRVPLHSCSGACHR